MNTITKAVILSAALTLPAISGVAYSHQQGNNGHGMMMSPEMMQQMKESGAMSPEMMEQMMASGEMSPEMMEQMMASEKMSPEMMEQMMASGQHRNMPMMDHQGMQKMMQMRMQHMVKMEQHLEKIESLLAQLLEVQKSK